MLSDDVITAVRKQYRQRDREQAMEKQEQIEEELLARAPKCSADTLMELHFPTLNDTELEHLVTTEFYNPSVMKGASCILNAVIPPVTHGSLTQNWKIRAYFHDLRVVRQNGTTGAILLAQIKKARNIFAIKVPSSVHEIVVGLYGTNLLRTRIPNFSYVFGGFKCSPPLSGPDGKVVTWCASREDPVWYGMYEATIQNETLATFVETCTAKQFLQCYMQVMYSLLYAHEAIDFTHYNLSADNVVVVQGGTQGVQINYGDEFLQTDHVAMITNYDHAHIVVDGMRIGRFGEEENGIFHDRTNIFFDAYKLLLSCYHHGNEEVRKTISLMHRFFNIVEDATVALRNRHFVPVHVNRELSFPQYLRYIRKVTDCSFIRPGPHPTRPMAFDTSRVFDDDAMDPLAVVTAQIGEVKRRLHIVHDRGLTYERVINLLTPIRQMYLDLAELYDKKVVFLAIIDAMPTDDTEEMISRKSVLESIYFVTDRVYPTFLAVDKILDEIVERPEFDDDALDNPALEWYRGERVSLAQFIISAQ